MYPLECMDIYIANTSLLKFIQNLNKVPHMKNKKTFHRTKCHLNHKNMWKNQQISEYGKGSKVKKEKKTKKI